MRDSNSSMKLSFSEAILLAASALTSASAQTITIGNFTFPLTPTSLHQPPTQAPPTQTTSINNAPPKEKPLYKHEPLLKNPPPLTIATINLLSKKNLAKACPAFFRKEVQGWKTVLPKRVNNNLNQLRGKKLADFVKLRLLQLKKGGRCFNCFSRGHFNSTCCSLLKCLLCNSTGHRLQACHLLRDPSLQKFSKGCSYQRAVPRFPNQKTHSTTPSISNNGSSIHLSASETVSNPPGLSSAHQRPAMPWHPPNPEQVEPQPEKPDYEDSVVSQEMQTQLYRSQPSLSTGCLHCASLTGGFLHNSLLTPGHLHVLSLVQDGIAIEWHSGKRVVSLFSLSLTIPFAIPVSSPFRMLQSISNLSWEILPTLTFNGPASTDVPLLGSDSQLLESNLGNSDLFEHGNDSNPVEPPGFEGPPRFGMQSDTVLLRRSPRLSAKNTGPYLSPAAQAELQTFGFNTSHSGKRKRKNTLPQPNSAFMKGTGPITRDQACFVITSAGFEVDANLLEKIHKVEIQPVG